MRTSEAQRSNDSLLSSRVLVLATMTVALMFLVFSGSALASSPPSVDSESASNITSTDATLEAQVNLHEAGAGAYYQFQLVRSPSEFASEILCPAKLPPGTDGCVGTQSASALPIGFIPGNTMQPGVDHPVSLDLASSGVTLQPGTTYHYRLLVARRVQTEDTIEWEPPTVAGPDQTFTTPPSAPVIESESVSHVTPTDATLEAKINPGGLETTYEVWVGTVSCIEFGGPADTCESTAKGQIVGTIPAGTSPQTVSVDVANAWRKLAPNSSYVFSVSATNSAGKGNANFKFFKTAAASPPSIESESVSHLTPTDATLEGQINTEGLETTYEFYLQEAPLCLDFGCEVPEHEPVALPAGKLLGSFVGQSVSADLNSAGVTLLPGADYRYWVMASNAAGPTKGQTQRFVAPEDGAAQPLKTTTPSGSHSTTGPAPNAGQGTVTPAAINPVGNVTPSSKMTVLTNAQKLAKALKVCVKKPKKQRASCVKQARNRYGTATKHAGKKASKRGKRENRPKQAVSFRASLYDLSGGVREEPWR